ncbi:MULTISPECIES: DUF4365 domain-containing protein [Kitasatospora]|uniref:DUF4365 domain-containing protein n=1 Tax=Kitasatospora setae (strain ATCC 33774 / DSM 43861 / JCM 3304 / KCC A-0304 / NBRC 14216 / KM-6054) TaxID=452652 RepID=E4NE44_KITSK|nr:DUF4365 domain-containing protein [Kitasatospora setae]BAJ29475.1 hypothetical protein KSE_36710 [Kitasatospora setae KM-6054]
MNAVRTLLEEHDHIVQEISGQNDFGEDLYVTFVEDEHVTSNVIRVQVKGGDKWRRANGYAVPVSRHGDTWADGNIPVYCVVYDPGNKRLFWANATQQLRRSGPFNRPKVIGVSPNAVLAAATMESFVAQARRYVGRYRDRQAVLTHLGEMSGVEFDPADHVLHIVNGYDEDLIFWGSPGDALATLLHSALDWEPHLVSLASLMRSEMPPPDFAADDETAARIWNDHDLSSAEDLGLSRAETIWVASCFMSTRQADEESETVFDSDDCEGCPNCTGEEPVEHAIIAADVLHEYVIDRIVTWFEAEPELLQRSISAMREEGDLEPEFVAELGPRP